jgi:hypothetical protein
MARTGANRKIALSVEESPLSVQIGNHGVVDRRANSDELHLNRQNGAVCRLPLSGYQRFSLTKRAEIDNRSQVKRSRVPSLKRTGILL